MLSCVQNRIAQNQTRGHGQAFSIDHEAIPALAIPSYDENGYVRGFIKGGVCNVFCNPRRQSCNLVSRRAHALLVRGSDFGALRAGAFSVRLW